MVYWWKQEIADRAGFGVYGNLHYKFPYRFNQRKKRVDISAKIQYFLSEQSFSHLMKLRVNYFNNTNYAETLNNINMDINQMTSVADSSVFFVITQAFSMTGGIIGLFIIDFRMTILVLLFIPIKCVVMKYFAKKQKQIMDEFIKKTKICEMVWGYRRRGTGS